MKWNNNKIFILIALIGIALNGCQTKTDSETPYATTENNAAAEVNVQLGLGYLGSGNTKRAKHKLLTALGQAPKSAMVNDAMGYFLEKTGSIREAEIYYKKGVSYAPGKGRPLNNYGTFLCRQGRYKEANSYFLRAVSDRSYVNLGEAYENAAICALKIPDPKKAEEYFNRALEFDPQRVTAHYELALLAYNRHDYAAANIHLIHFHGLHPANDQSTKLARQIKNQLGTQNKTKEQLALIDAKSKSNKQ